MRSVWCWSVSCMHASFVCSHGCSVTDSPFCDIVNMQHLLAVNQGMFIKVAGFPSGVTFVYRKNLIQKAEGP